MTMDPGNSAPDAARSAEDIRHAAHDAGDAMRQAAHEATDKVREAGADKVDRGSDAASASLRQVADQLKQAGQGLEQDQAWAGKAILAGATGLERAAGYLSQGRFDDFSRDLQTLARTNPAVFLGGSVALGFVAARLAKTAAHQAAQPETPAPQSKPQSEFSTPSQSYAAFDPMADDDFPTDRQVM